jgi:hypothetical protein
MCRQLTLAKRCLGWAAGTAGAAGMALLLFTPPAEADPPLKPFVVERVEVRVPVDDTVAELVQMQMAAAAAALVTAAAMKPRLRRRVSPAAASAVIDISDSSTFDRRVS